MYCLAARTRCRVCSDTATGFGRSVAARCCAVGNALGMRMSMEGTPRSGPLLGRYCVPRLERCELRTTPASRCTHLGGSGRRAGVASGASSSSSTNDDVPGSTATALVPLREPLSQCRLAATRNTGDAPSGRRANRLELCAVCGSAVASEKVGPLTALHRRPARSPASSASHEYSARPSLRL